MILKRTILFLAVFLTAKAVMGQGDPPGLIPPELIEPKDPLPEEAPVPALASGQVPDPNEIQIPAGKRWELLSEDGNGIGLLYFTLTGKTVLVSSQAAQAEISLLLPGPLTRGQMARFLEKKLLMEGFALEESGPMEMKLLLAAGAAANPKTDGTRIISSIDELTPGTDEFASWVMTLNYLKPEEAGRLFQQVIGQFGAAGSIAPAPNASALIVSGNSPMLRKIDELRKRIDVPSAKVAQTFVSVVYADVEELATQLNELFNQTTNQGNSARVQRTQQGANQIPGLVANNQGGGAAAGAGEETPINILADTRTNRIFLMGRPVDIAFVESLIADFDQPSSDRNLWTYRLKYLPVIEFLPIAEDALSRILGDSSGGAGGSSLGSRSNTSNNRNTNRNQPNTNQTGAGGSSGSSSRGQAGVSGQERETAPESFIVGKTQLVADNVSNSILVNGPPHHVEVIQKLVERLDRPTQQIAITAVFGSYDLLGEENFGVDFGALISSDNDNFAGRSGTSSPSVLDPGEFTGLTDLVTQSPEGLALYGAFNGDFGVFVNAFESDSNATVLQRPTVFTTNNKTARISSGQRIAVPTGTFSSGGTGVSQSTNIEFRDIVLELEVLPLINGDDEVTLDISLVRDGVGASRTIVGIGDVPDINTEEISTIVTIPNRSTIVLGGLITEDESEGGSGVPILRSIPGLGKLFGSTNSDSTRRELVIMIHPTIISDEAQLDHYQRESDSQIEIGERTRASLESDLLPQKGELIPRDDKGATHTVNTRYVEPAKKELRRKSTRNGKRP